MNNSQEFTLKELRLKLDEVVTVEVDGSNSGDAVSAADSNEKRRRKSALKAAVTFSRLAEEELADEDGNLPAKLKKRCIEDRTKDNVTEDDMCQRGGEDQDYKCSSSDEASNEPEEEYGVSDNDDSDFDEVSNADSRKSGSSIPKGGTKCLDILLSKFRGKYREPIPVPISDEKRTAWRQDLVLHGRIACKDCGVLYTTFCGMEYHYQRCNKLEYGYKCLRVTSATRKHSQSPRDFVEFSKFYYDAPHATKIVHPSWKYERTMWNRIEPQEADQYLTAMTTSPLITIKRAAVGACDEDTPQRILDLHESVSEPGSEHDTIYVGGAVWAVKWVPLPRKLVDIKHTKDDGTAISVKGCDDDSANREKTERQQQHQEEDPIETELDSSSHQSSVHSDIDLGHEEYLLTVSHSKGSQPELMQLNKAGIVMMDERLSKGSLSLWAVSLDHSDDKEPQSSKTGIPKGTYQSMDENGNKKTRVRRCYTICHEWGFVARVEFCPSRAFTENRLGLLAVTSQAGFVRILALPHPTASDEGAFYLDPIPVAILEPAEMSGSLCVSWDPLRDHGHMLVGYANGNVEMFTLRHRTLLVTEDEALEPSKRLGSHGLSVSSVQWHFLADRRVAVSAGFDDNIIIWDIDSGAILGRCSRLVCRDMRTFQFLPSLVASYEESVTPSPCVTVYESGAYKRSESTILAYTVGTAFGLDVNHWRHMVAMADSAGLVTLAWVTNAGKLRNFRNRGLQVVLFQALQTFPEGVDTVSEDVAHGVGTVEFRDFVPSWEFPTPPQSLEITPSARLEYPLNSVLSVAFNPNYPTGDHLVASGLRCGIVRVSRVDYSTDSGVHNNLTFPVNDTRTRCRVSWRSKARKGTMSTKE
ncbi:hypothetical protein BIW11_02472 [Tropilaelaps mercedesae]|uniref:Uncharacterized protein n=1 Tax=Tropilaelaps mercedesae TaxID=418985 RepID=A0A1V9Y2I2_9ACAR|nr:hypothetical protein BIW11_02472 [Tropilaelaps mercedesae]